ncbi:MAG TPA: c-type cytochrome [Bryobacteraceae bacterium]|nr:c-type cytochrome [Bryobacteraceae bacterium]
MCKDWLFRGGPLVLIACAPLFAQEHAGSYAAADIQYGATVYALQCTTCHGPNGDSISGVDLRSGRFRNASSDDDLRRIVTIGIPGTSMPGRQLDTAQMTGLIAYLRNMRDFNTGAVALGDPSRGRALFEGKGRCATCHRVNGKGSRLAPDLSDIGTSRAASTIQRSLIDPSSTMIPINRPVRVVTKDGKTINGRRLNEDTYTVQIIDDQERLLSLSKPELREYTILKTSSMPSYKGALNDQEMSDVVAYLVSLKGK